MNIHELINPVSTNSTTTTAPERTKKRPSPSTIDSDPALIKRTKLEPNGTKHVETPTIGKHGLPLVPPHLKIREIPIWAQRHSAGHGFDLRPGTSGGGGGGAATISSTAAAGGGGDAKSTHSVITPDGATISIARPPSSHQPKQWEANILDEIPLDQMSKTIADWMFASVVQAPDLGPSARWEIEAKLGHIIDQGTNMRLHVPGLTDFILDRSQMRVSFRSSMTEAQHRGFNEFLNTALMRSLPPKDATATPIEGPRIPMAYKHTRQIDTFYALMPEGRQSLPPMTQPYVSHHSRVRVTKDQKTGEVLASIVKLRVDDLDIISPRGVFDVRISANVEIDYHGPIEDLKRVTEGGNETSPRNKDRMTYNHLAYQIDLTQVTMMDVADVVTKEHELEVEIMQIDELRQQGARLRSGEMNTYLQMVNGFMDNIRLLQRQAMLV